MNITAPFKLRAFALAQHHTSRCHQSKAANTLYCKNQELWADNTDGVGLSRDLLHYFHPQDKKIVILGAGGAARGIISFLLELQPATVVIANRSKEKIKELKQDFPEIEGCLYADLTSAVDLILHASAAHDDNDFQVLPKQLFAQQPFCYDLNYNITQVTPFLQHSITYGCKGTDGLGMLIEQAAEAFYAWHGVYPDTSLIRKKGRDLFSAGNSIVIP